MVSDFKTFERVNKTKFLRVESNRLEECINYYNQNIDAFFGVMLSDIGGYKLNNIDFLVELISVRGLIVANEIENMDGLNSLKELEYLQLDKVSQQLDLSLHKSLKNYRGDWNKKIINLTNAKSLSELALWSYKPECGDLSEIALLPNLKKFELVSSPMENLVGIEGSYSIESISFHYMRKLEDISAIGRIKSPLKNIHFENCPKITSYSGLSGCKHLESLDIEKSAVVDNFSFIKDLPKLEKLFFVGTKLMDKSVSPYMTNKSLQKVVDTKGNVLPR